MFTPTKLILTSLLATAAAFPSARAATLFHFTEPSGNELAVRGE